MENKIFTLNFVARVNFARFCVLPLKSKVQNSSTIANANKLFFPPCTIFLKLQERMFSRRKLEKVSRNQYQHHPKYNSKQHLPPNNWNTKFKKEGGTKEQILENHLSNARLDVMNERNKKQPSKDLLHEGLRVTRWTNRGWRSRRIGTCRAFLAFPGKSLKFIMEEARSVRKRKEKAEKEKRRKRKKEREESVRIPTRQNSLAWFLGYGIPACRRRPAGIATSAIGSSPPALSALRSADRSPFGNLFRPIVLDGYCPACYHHPRVAPGCLAWNLARWRTIGSFVDRSYVRTACLLAPVALSDRSPHSANGNRLITEKIHVGV